MIDKRTLNALEYGKVLDYLAALCISATGREAALALRPLPDTSEAREAALLFDESRTWAGLNRSSNASGGKGDKHEAPFRMEAFPDISGVLRFLASPAVQLDPDALWALREVLRLARRALASLRRGDAATLWPRLLFLADACPLPERTGPALDRCLGDDGLLRDESSPELLLVRTDLRRLHQTCMRKVKDFALQYNMLQYLQDEFMTLASDRYVLPLKANFKGRMQGIIHDWSQTGETCYFEPMFLVEINNRLQELKRTEREEERKVLAYLTSLVRDERPGVEGAAALLTTLDVLLAKGRLADAFDGQCVTLTDEDGVELKNVRHPLLALAGASPRPAGAESRSASAPSPARPIDISLRPGERGLIISGGNAGGKTVCLKTLGLTALMAMTGLPVPAAKGSRLPVWQRIHAFIGDEQSLDDHVSTFTAQIRHLAQAWDGMDSRTLVLLDEFGAGTDPSQGAALAQAVLDELLDRDVYVAAATHFPALKAYALTREKARAASVLFDPDTRRPLFRLAYDQVGASQALDVAREHGLPEAILRRAEQYLLLDGQDASAVMTRLNALAVEREKEVAALRREQERRREKRRALQERFERERRQLHDDVRRKAAELMQAWKEGRATHKQALREMAKLRADLAASPATEDAPSTPAPAELRPGQHVLHRPFGKKAVITDIDTRRGRVRIDMNGVSLWAAVKDVQPVEAAPGAASRATAGLSAPAGPLLRLDLRGKRADLALNELSRFLDKALLAGMESVEIVHGRGTGVLRKEVHAFLKSFPGIKDATLAPEDRGGDGMTIVEFR